MESIWTDMSDFFLIPLEDARKFPHRDDDDDDGSPYTIV